MLHILEVQVAAVKHCNLVIAARLKLDGLGQVAARLCRLGTRLVVATTEGTFGQGDVGERWYVGKRQGFWQHLIAIGCPLWWYILCRF